MKKLLLLLLASCTPLLADDPTIKSELGGARLGEFTKTGLIVRRTIAMDIAGKPEEKALDIPVVIRTGSLYLEADAADKLMALRGKIAEFSKKSEELQKIGESLKSEYIEIVSQGRPKIAADQK